MAKKSAVLRDEKRRKMYEKYQAKRAELKAAGDWKVCKSFHAMLRQLG